MSSARRRTSSNNNHTPIGSKDKPRISLQRRSQSGVKVMPLWMLTACRLKIFCGLIMLMALVYLFQTIQSSRLATIGRSKVPSNIVGPFPNLASITSQGRDALQTLLLGGIPVASQVTFVVPILKRRARGSVLLVSRLQSLKCPIHLLVSPDQTAELEYLLDQLLPTRNHTSIYPGDARDPGMALTLLHHAKHVETPWVWITGSYENELQGATIWMESMAQSIPRVRIPVGMYGARLSGSSTVCISSTNQPEPVAFLVPPFLAPTSLLVESESGIVTDTPASVWASLGERIASITHLGMGGVVSAASHGSPQWCELSHIAANQGSMNIPSSMVDSLRDRFRSSMPKTIRFVFLLPNQESLRQLAPTACRMIRNGHEVYITVQSSGEEGLPDFDDKQHRNFGCHLHYTIGLRTVDGYREEILALADDWCSPSSLGNKVLIVNELEDDIGYGRVSKERLCALSVLYLSGKDLDNSEWLAMLHVDEWQAWDEPTIELAVVTHDRPWSLKRLLDSMKRAHYFGDKVNVVINLEQTADLETRHIAESFEMGSSGGNVAVRHRIVHAGLMTAVVESWHPHGNHSYGVLLEDDVELSPMFYAWVKFCVLRYRYGTAVEDSSQLYGISLYQPKVTELHMEGRLPFDARDIFAKLNIGYPNTPYLSQVPCSWGAVYFPEHWREFQQYLALRLSEYVMPVTDIVVPDLRSNRWSRSWKKFFNEMVYLRGYVSLYPNYDHFVSLSTNHLEVGEHVPANINQEKQRQYFLPLMQDHEAARPHPGTERGVTLLDLPMSTLPKWADLPVLDLWGDISTLENIRRIGIARRANMSLCHPDETQFDALKYICPIGGATPLVDDQKSATLTLVEDDGPDLMQG